MYVNASWYISSILWTNIFKDTGPRLYETCPSGNYFDYYAQAIGSRCQAARTYLEKTFDTYHGGIFHCSGLQCPCLVILLCYCGYLFYFVISRSDVVAPVWMYLVSTFHVVFVEFFLTIRQHLRISLSSMHFLLFVRQLAQRVRS